MARTTISIALTTYNGAAYLAQQLASLAAQTRLPDELVVGDDRSSDATIAILEAFAADAPFPVRVTINPHNLGFGRNFAQTLLRCTGDTIFFCDQDDVWDADKLARCCERLAVRGEPGVVTHDARLADAELRDSGETLCGQARAGGAAGGAATVYGCCMGFDRFFAGFFTPDHRHSHDTWLISVAELLGALEHFDEPLISYRRHGGNVTAGFAARLTRTSRFARLGERWRSARGGSLGAEIAAQIELHRDLAEAFARQRGPSVAAFGAARVEAAEQALAAKLARLDARARLIAHPRLVRIATIAGLRREAGYRRPGALGLLREILA